MMIPMLHERSGNQWAFCEAVMGARRRREVEARARHDVTRDAIFEFSQYRRGIMTRLCDRHDNIASAERGCQVKDLQLANSWKLLLNVRLTANRVGSRVIAFLAGPFFR